MDYQMSQVFQTYLLREESVVWVGQPDYTRLFTAADILLVPLSLLWGGFAIYWETSVITLALRGGRDFPIIFPLFGIPFVLIGLYMIFGRFFYRKWSRKRTFYAVTNKRALVLNRTWSSQLWNSQLQSISLDQTPAIKVKDGKDGVGTVSFGGGFWLQTEASSPVSSRYSISFVDIKDARRVYDLIQDVKNRKPLN